MRTFYIDLGDQKKGPYTLNQLRSMWKRGAVKKGTLYCEEGGSEWRKLEMLQGVLEADDSKTDSADGGLKGCLEKIQIWLKG